jgi:hypothetical protein
MTISYNRLGSNGRLGNQMFQYAGLRGIAAHRGFDWMIPPADNYGDSNYGLFDCFEMSSVQEKNLGVMNAQSIATGQFHFSQEFFDTCPDNVNLHDYFQTEKYFENIKDEIKKDFIFKENILEPCKEIIEDIDNPIFIHVRRGDYLNSQQAHPVCPIEYYERALSHFDSDIPALVFSDDIEWCKQQDLFSDDRFMISEYQEYYSQTCDTNDGRQRALVPYFDLCLMSLCSGGIMANSSMSWWGSWLQQDTSRSIVAPNTWFGPQYKDYNMNDLLPESWKVVSYE